MNLHEYQAKELFKEARIPVLDGGVATTPEEARAVAEKLGGDIWVVKAQVHAGGRGKAGGVKVTKDIKEVAQIASSMLGTNLVTKQTDEKGLPVNSVYIEAGAEILDEWYLSLLIDRSNDSYTFVASIEGGMDIEQVAEENSEKIHKFSVSLPSDYEFMDVNGMPTIYLRQTYPIDEMLQAGFRRFINELFRDSMFSMGVNKEEVDKNYPSDPKIFDPSNIKIWNGDIKYHQHEKLLLSLLNLAIQKDASMIEINPLALLIDGWFALDTKIAIDSNALFRQEELLRYRDTSQEDPLEVKASENDLSYVSLEGEIACMVNGAGLAMATMDVIKLHGGEPANFLDVGGGATPDRVKHAFDIIMENPKVKGILVNIFGGIVRCDVIAEGIIAAVGKSDINVPIVVRLEGTNVDLGKELLSKSGLKVIPADDLTDAALKIVDSVKCS